MHSFSTVPFTLLCFKPTWSFEMIMAHPSVRKCFTATRTSAVDDCRSCWQLMVLCATGHNRWDFWLVVWNVIYVPDWFFNISIYGMNLNRIHANKKINIQNRKSVLFSLNSKFMILLYLQYIHGWYRGFNKHMLPNCIDSAFPPSGFYPRQCQSLTYYWLIHL